jgi:hypothetical protein
MSKLTEIQNQYQGYTAAHKAVEQTKPDMIEVIYKEGKDFNGAPYKRTEGYFLYDPIDDGIKIVPVRDNPSDCIRIKSEDAIALVKALRKFFE